MPSSPVGNTHESRSRVNRVHDSYPGDDVSARMQTCAARADGAISIDGPMISHEVTYPSSKSSAARFSVITLSISSLLRGGASGLADSSEVLGVRRSGTWNQMNRIKVWVFLTTSDHAVLPIQYWSYPQEARYEITKPMTTPRRRILARFKAWR
jgi:hypothetical protein